MRYHLPQHVYYCSNGSYGIFLDVDRDQYLAVDKDSIDALVSRIPPCRNECPHSIHGEEMPRAATSLASDLIKLGLLTTSGLGSKAFAPITSCTPRSIPPSPQPMMTNALRFSAFYAACRTANRRLAAMSMKETIATLRQRKRRQCVCVQLTTLYSLVATFRALRLLYPRPYLCLFDSLALIEFLAGYGIFATWVFGVQGEPFFAHCWVQYDDLLLNDSLDRAIAYTPIMVV